VSQKDIAEVVATLDEVLGADATDYATVKAHGVTIRLGSLSSEDIIEWIEANEKPETRRFGGLQLIVKSIVNKDGTRIPAGEREKALDKFKAKDARQNGLIVAACLKLNGLDKASREAAKND
jgi:hypothetical protein